MPCKRDDYFCTPPDLFKALDDIMRFELDAAATDQNALVKTHNGKHKGYLTEADDSLSQDWRRLATRVFINPPFSKEGRKDDFIEKAAREAQKGASTVMVIPTKTSTAAFHDFIYQKPNVQIEFLRRRPRFYLDGKPTGGGRNDIMIVVFWNAKPSIAEEAENMERARKLRKAIREYRQAKPQKKTTEAPAKEESGA